MLYKCLIILNSISYYQLDPNKASLGAKLSHIMQHLTSYKVGLLDIKEASLDDILLRQI